MADWRAVDGIVLLDKPLGFSSNQALQRVRRIFRAAKAGHAGSLDPLATGMLPICLGQATKLCGHLLNSSKTYRATAKLGVATSTGDAEGEIIRRSDVSGLSLDRLKSVMSRFEGRIHQVPPMYSALKHQGRRLYELARAGEAVEREARELTIHRLELVEWREDVLVLDVSCSKGTYIRTLVEDIAGAAGQAAHLIGLRRQEVTPFEASAMIELDRLETLAEQGFNALDAVLLPLRAAVQGWPLVTATPLEADRLGRGLAISKDIPAPGAADETLGILDEQGVLIGLGVRTEADRIQPKRWLAASPLGL